MIRWRISVRSFFEFFPSHVHGKPNDREPVIITVIVICQRSKVYVAGRSSKRDPSAVGVDGVVRARLRSVTRRRHAAAATRRAFRSNGPTGDARTLQQTLFCHHRGEEGGPEVRFCANPFRITEAFFSPLFACRISSSVIEKSSVSLSVYLIYRNDWSGENDVPISRVTSF